MNEYLKLYVELWLEFWHACGLIPDLESKNES